MLAHGFHAHGSCGIRHVAADKPGIKLKGAGKAAEDSVDFYSVLIARAILAASARIVKYRSFCGCSAENAASGHFDGMTTRLP